MRRKREVLILVAGVAVAGFATVTRAQERIQLEAQAGVAVPTGELRSFGDIGPTGGLALAYRVSDWLALHADGDYSHMMGAQVAQNGMPFDRGPGLSFWLAAIGLYGVVSYTVTQRMREFAVRIAVGAPARAVMRLVAHDAAVMILAGTGIGAFLAMWASKLLGDWLYSVYHTDAVSLLVAEAVLFAAGFAACFQPALRAMRADPIEILRAI